MRAAHTKASVHEGEPFTEECAQWRGRQWHNVLTKASHSLTNVHSVHEDERIHWGVGTCSVHEGETSTEQCAQRVHEGETGSDEWAQSVHEGETGSDEWAQRVQEGDTGNDECARSRWRAIHWPMCTVFTRARQTVTSVHRAFTRKMRKGPGSLSGQGVEPTVSKGCDCGEVHVRIDSHASRELL